MIADEDVLEGIDEAVADVKVAVGVGRWHDDGIVVSIFVLCGLEGAGRFPESVNVGFKLVGFVGFTKLHD